MKTNGCYITGYPSLSLELLPIPRLVPSTWYSDTELHWYGFISPCLTLLSRLTSRCFQLILQILIIDRPIMLIQSLTYKKQVIGREHWIVKHLRYFLAAELILIHFMGVVSKRTWFRIIKQASLSHRVAEYNLKVSSANYQKPMSPLKQHPMMYISLT